MAATRATLERSSLPTSTTNVEATSTASSASRPLYAGHHFRRTPDSPGQSARRSRMWAIRLPFCAATTRSRSRRSRSVKSGCAVSTSRRAASGQHAAASELCVRRRSHSSTRRSRRSSRSRPTRIAAHGSVERRRDASRPVVMFVVATALAYLFMMDLHWLGSRCRASSGTPNGVGVLLLGGLDPSPGRGCSDAE